jgi:hypothetical protein
MISESVTQEKTPGNGQHGPFYIVFVEDVEYTFDHTPVTGAEIMDAAGIPYSVGLIQILPDGTQKSIGVDEEIELKPGQSFKKAPRFKRG